ncbi:MAG: arylsulfotransferase family protein, partial [Solirubrobacteraceae bacterium]
NTWQLYVIDDSTGRIEMTAGGKHPTLKMEAGTTTAYQHDANTLENGDISIFDNGGLPFEHPQSRGLIVSLNPQQGTDTKVAELVHPRALQAGSQGSVQELPGGDWFVGWGAEPYFTEFNASGEMIYDAHLSLQPIKTSHGEHAQSYRAYKSEWTGAPSYPPAVAVERTGSGVTVYASWNGSTEVASWQVLGGTEAGTMKALSSAARSGFETAIAVPAEPYYEVRALDGSGAVIGRSQPVKG